MFDWCAEIEQSTHAGFCVLQEKSGDWFLEQNSEKSIRVRCFIVKKKSYEQISLPEKKNSRDLINLHHFMRAIMRNKMCCARLHHFKGRGQGGPGDTKQLPMGVWGVIIWTQDEHTALQHMQVR